MTQRTPFRDTEQGKEEPQGKTEWRVGLTLGKTGLKTIHTHTNPSTLVGAVILVATQPSKALHKQLFWEMLLATRLFLRPPV